MECNKFTVHIDTMKADNETVSFSSYSQKAVCVIFGRGFQTPLERLRLLHRA